MQKLKAPEGVTDVSFGGKNYPANEKGIVTVPVEAGLTLFQFGFTVAPEETEPVAPEQSAEVVTEPVAPAPKTKR